MNNVYLASGFHHRFVLRLLSEKLIEHGYKTCSSWIWIDERPERGDLGWPYFAYRIAHQNIIDLYRADVLIVDAEGIRKDGNGGAHSEIGFMLARGKPIYIVGELNNTFCFASDVTKVGNYKELLEKLSEREIVSALNPIV